MEDEKSEVEKNFELLDLMARARLGTDYFDTLNKEQAEYLENEILIIKKNILKKNET